MIAIAVEWPRVFLYSSCVKCSAAFRDIAGLEVENPSQICPLRVWTDSRECLASDINLSVHICPSFMPTVFPLRLIDTVMHSARQSIHLDISC